MAIITPTRASAAADVAFGLGLLSSFGQKVDIVGIYSGNGTTFEQLFKNARPMRATIREDSRVMEHPIETGSMIADHHIINPVEIDLPMIINSENYASTYTQMRQALKAGTLLSVKTRTGIYSDMIIMGMPHEEDPEMYDAITVGLRLRQVQFFESGADQLKDNFQPLDPANDNTITSGLQNAVPLLGKLLTSAQSISSYASFFIGKF